MVGLVSEAVYAQGVSNEDSRALGRQGEELGQGRQPEPLSSQGDCGRAQGCAPGQQWEAGAEAVGGGRPTAPEMGLVTRSGLGGPCPELLQHIT